jgi:hypothetical protein
MSTIEIKETPIDGREHDYGHEHDEKKLGGEMEGVNVVEVQAAEEAYVIAIRGIYSLTSQTVCTQSWASRTASIRNCYEKSTSSYFP